jgi:3-dehydroquinate dehydratase/shikimate dehydrogenase
MPLESTRNTGDRALIVATVGAGQRLPPLATLPSEVGALRLCDDVQEDISSDWFRSRFGGLLLYALPAQGKEVAVGLRRREKLARAAAAFDLIELEADRDISEELLAAIPPEKRLITWRGPATDAASLGSIFHQLSATPARCYELTVTPRRVTDGLATLNFLAGLNRRDVVAYAEGELGLWSRVLAPRFGGRIVFGSFGRPAATAESEPSVERLVGDFGFPSLNPINRLYGIVGHPVVHSLSPRLHNAAYRILAHDALYLPFVVSSADLGMFWQEFVRDPALGRLRMPLCGLTVASPLKENARAFANRSSPETEAAASSNLLTCHQGEWTAHTTDPAGVLTALRRRSQRIMRRRAAIVGCGGSGRGIALALARAGGLVTLVNRSHARGLWASKLLQLPFVPLSHFSPDRYDLIINATPVGREEDSVPFAVDGIDRNAMVIDLVYATRTTPLVAAARARGLLTVDGREVLEIQVARQFAAMTGLRFPDELLTEPTTRRTRERLPRDLSPLPPRPGMGWPVWRDLR